MIRTATRADMPEILRLGRDFHAACPYRDFPLDLDAFAEFAGRLIDHGVIFLSEDGMIGGLMSAMYFNPEVRTGAELFWWAPKGGQALRKAFELWAKDQGAVAVQFSGLADDRAETVTKLFRRAGYQPAEMAFFKRF